jgi:hypothetical protein
VKFKPRTMDDIRALDPDGRKDEQVFSTVAQVSELTTAAYKQWMRPLVRSVVSEPAAEVTTHLSADRVQRIAASDVNPAMRAVGPLAQRVRENRARASDDNVFTRLERGNSARITRALESYGRMRDESVAMWVKWMYGPFGWGAMFPPAAPAEEAALARATVDLEAAHAELEPRLAEGGFPEGLMRMLLIAFHEKGSIRRRSIRLARIATETTDELIANGKLEGVTGPVDWRSVRDLQAQLLALFPERALETLPELLANPGERELAAAMVGRIMLRDPEVADPHSDLLRKAQDVLGVQFETAAANDDLPEELRAIELMQTA